MYPRNAVSPPRIALGAVIQISDGAVQITGVSIVVRAEGGSEIAGGGIIAYGTTSSIVYYTPTQAETNYIAFVVAAYKTGCIPISQTVITTASATSGAVVLSGETHTNAVIPTVSTLTGHTAQTGDAYAVVTDGIYGLAALETLVDELEGRLSATRAGYLDNLSGGAVALEVTLTSMKGATFDTLTDSLEALRNRGDSAWTTATGFSTHSAPDVWAVTTRLLTAGTNIVLAKGVGVTGLNDLDAAGIAAATWNAATATYGSAGSYGLLLETNLDAPVSGATAPTAVEVADTILDRNLATGVDSGSATIRTVRQALRLNRNKTTVIGGTLTVTKEDDATVSWTAAVTTAAGDPIVGIDPAS